MDEAERARWEEAWSDNYRDVMLRLGFLDEQAADAEGWPRYRLISPRLHPPNAPYVDPAWRALGTALERVRLDLSHPDVGVVAFRLTGRLAFDAAFARCEQIARWLDWHGPAATGDRLREALALLERQWDELRSWLYVSDAMYTNPDDARWELDERWLPLERAFTEVMNHLAMASGDEEKTPIKQPDTPQRNPPSMKDRLAYQSYQFVIEQQPDLLENLPTGHRYSQEMHEYAKQHFDGYEETSFLFPGDFDTWKTYVRRWERHIEGTKNTPRASRPHGGSIVNASDI